MQRRSRDHKVSRLDPANIMLGWFCWEHEKNSGVACNSDGKVEKIVLYNTSLEGELSPALSGLKSLRSLMLFGNRFRGNIPGDYGGIESLWKINLSSGLIWVNPRVSWGSAKFKVS
nr:probable LRR receptor-like serine/threonine-protein kinase At1g12460 [Ipomoea batatas]GMD34271.1 probable LRR receptor-like serine/threonine-protein kinase At1g12460 [Ipomoea batatas]